MRLLREVWSHRHLVGTLARRQFRLRYRQSFIGMTWAIIPPLGTLGVATLVFDGVARVDTGNTAYPIFTMAALVPWSFFSSAVTSGFSSVVASSGMITRVAFPRATLPFGLVGLSLIDLGVAGLLFVGFTFLFGRGLPVTALMFPIPLLIEIVLIMGVVLLTSAMNVFARDVRMIVPLLVQFWLFLTPVMYPLKEVPAELKTVFLLNPMTGIVETFRRLLLHGQGLDLRLLMPSIIGAVLMLLVGIWYFSTTEKRFADVI